MRRPINKILFKFIYFCAVFLISVLIFVSFSGREDEDRTSVLGEAGLPLVRLLLPESGEVAASLHGYLDPMDIRSMRGGIYPLSPGRRVRFRILTFGGELGGLRFEVRDITGENLVEQSAISDFQETGYGNVEGSFVIKDLIREGVEYTLVLRADTALGETAYYSRIILLSEEAEAFVEEGLRFAGRFSENTFDPEARSEVSRYLEPDRTGDNASYAAVNIHSSLSQVTWGELPIASHSAPMAQLNDIRGDIIALTLSQTVVLTGEDGRLLPCDVEEVYRLRQGSDRIYLLGYERAMNYRFTGETADISESGIALGIAQERFPFLENESGDVLAFAAGKGLYIFDKRRSEMSELFAFADSEHGDERCLWTKHMYRLLRIDESGDLRFLVAGYMNRGPHEGRVGIGLYRYQAQIRQVEEIAFLPVAVSPEILCAWTDRMAYADGDDALYLMLGDDVVMLDPAQDALSPIIEGAADTSYYRSASGELFAWGEDEGGAEIKIQRFRSGETTRVEAEPGTRLVVLGFMQEDLIYGILREEDIKRDQTGNEVYAMERIRICDADGNLLEDYHSPGNLVVGAEVEDNRIQLRRVRLNESTGFYEETAGDQIINLLEAQTRINRLVVTSADPWKARVEIGWPKKSGTRSAKLMRPSLLLPEGGGETEIYVPEADFAGYYVYDNGGGIARVTSSEAEAVELAESKASAVTDGSGRCVWEKRTLSVRNQIMSITRSVAAAERKGEESAAAYCLRLMLEQRGINRNVMGILDQGASLSEVLDESLPEARALTLTGCSLASVLYYVDQDIPVMVTMRDGSAMLLIGYNDTELVLVDPEGTNGSERVRRITRSQGSKLFQENGNRFTTYYIVGA